MKNPHKITALFLMSAAAALSSGCKSTKFSQLKPDGSRMEITDRRLFLGTKAKITGNWDTNGILSVTVDAASATDAATVKAIVQGAVEALK